MNKTTRKYNKNKQSGVDVEIVQVQIAPGHYIVGYSPISLKLVTEIFWEKVPTSPSMCHCYCHYQEEGSSKEDTFFKDLYLYQDSKLNNPVQIRKLDLVKDSNG